MEQHEYWKEIENLGKEVIQECQSGDWSTGEQCREAMLDWIHETLDSHHSVIYTGEAMDVLRHSRNDSAMIDNFGSDGVMKDGQLNWSAMAYCAMEEDLMEWLHQADDFDVNDPNPA